MKLLKNKKIIALLAFVLIMIALVATLTIITSNTSNAPKGMRQVKSYVHHGVCEAVNDPECGYCPGTVIDEECFVNKGVLEQYP